MRLEDENIQDIAPFGVRMPSALKAKIKEAAKKHKHSMNAEIVTRLEKSFSDVMEYDKLLAEDDIAFIVKNVMKRLRDNKVSKSD